MELDTGSSLPDTGEELLYLLKAPGQELKRVLSAAQKLLQSPQILVPRKSHFLLDWATNLLIKTSTRHTDPEKACKEGVVLVFLEPAVWRFFESLLKNETLQSQATINPKLVSVVDNVFQHLHYRHSHTIQSDQDEALAESVAYIFNFIFQHYSNLIRPRFDQFTQTLASISSLALKFLSRDASTATRDETSPLVHSFLLVLSTALKVYRQLCFDASAPNKVFSAVVEDLLENFLGLLDLCSHSLRSTSQFAKWSEEQKNRLNQVVSLLEKTVQYALFGPAQIEEFNSAFSPSIAYGQDCFMLMNKKSMSSGPETHPPVAKRAKTGKSSDMAPKFENNASIDVSKSYVKRLFDWLLAKSKDGDIKAEIVLSSLPFLYRLCVSNIFSSRGRFATPTSDSDPSTSSTLGSSPSDGNGEPNDENSEISTFANDTVALMSQKTMKVLWNMFSAFQRICIQRIKLEIVSPKGDIVKNRFLARSIASNTALLSIVREYDVYSHSQQGIGERMSYLTAHTADMISISSGFPELDVVFGSFRVLLELDQTFVEDYLGPLLRIVWAQPVSAQIESDAFCAALINVYGLLRQIDVLMTRILEHIHKAEIVGFFGTQFWAALETNFELLPYGLIVPIFNIFLSDMKDHYIAKLPNISNNVVHAEALFNHLLENLKLSPALATELCQHLDMNVKLICGPLLNDFLEAVKKYHKLQAKKTESKKLTKLLKPFAAGIPQHAQAGLALFHIFVTFENYCKNRFFPSHNTPDTELLKTEAVPPFSKLDSSVLLDQVCHFISALSESGHGHARMGSASEKVGTNAAAWRFRSVLFHTAIQRSVKLFKIVSTVPPVNLPSLVRRHEEATELKKIALEELSSLLRFINSEFAQFARFYCNFLLNTPTSGAMEGVQEGSNESDPFMASKMTTSVSTSWQVADMVSYWLYMWDTLCVHAPLIVFPDSPSELSQGFIQKLIQLQYHHSSVASSPIQSTDASKHRFTSLLYSSTLKCWLSAPFYEIEGVKKYLVPTIMQELYKSLCDQQCQPLSDLITGSPSTRLLSKAADALNAIRSSVLLSDDTKQCFEILKLLNSLPTELWTLADVQAAFPPLLVLLRAALETSASEMLVTALLVSLKMTISSCSASRSRLRRSSTSESALSPSQSLLQFLDQEHLFNQVLLKTYLISPRETAAVLASIVEQCTYDHHNDKKAAKFIKKCLSAIKKVKDRAQNAHLLQAVISGLVASLQTKEVECNLHMEWIRTNQRNNIGWKAPPQKFIIFGAKVQKLLQPLQTSVESMVSNLASDLEGQVSGTNSQSKRENGPSNEIIQSGLLAFHSLLSLIDLSRLQKSKLSQFLDKNGVQMNPSKADIAISMPADLQLPTLLALIRWNFSKSASPSHMDVDGPIKDHGCSNRDEIAFDCLAALARCLPTLGQALSEEEFGLIVSSWYSLLLDAGQGEKAMKLLELLVPRLSPFQCRYLLSHLNYELHKITSRDKTQLSTPAWETDSNNDDRVRTLHVLIQSLSSVLPLIDASVSYDVLSQYSSRLIVTLCGILESSVWPSLGKPLESEIHVKIVSLLTLLVGDKFVEISGAELNTVSQLLGVVLAKHHAIQSAPSLLQISKDLNLSVPLSKWSSIIVFTPEIFTAYYHLLSTIIHARPLQMAKNIATIILHAKILLYAAVLRTSPSQAAQLEAIDVKPLKKLHAEYVGRLYKDIANLGPHMRSFAVHILVDFITLLERESVSPPIRLVLNPGIYALVDLLEENEQNLILKSVNATGKAIFKQVYQDFEREHKYQGKA